MTAPDYSKGVPRSVVEKRRADNGLAMPPGFSSSCSLCDYIGSEIELGDGCSACPGVFVPIIEDEPANPSLGPHHRDGCDGQSWRYSGSGYNRVRVCSCGAEDFAPEPGSLTAALSRIEDEPPKEEREPCGHPKSSIVANQSGAMATMHCGDCEEEARKAEPSTGGAREEIERIMSDGDLSWSACQAIRALIAELDAARGRVGALRNTLIESVRAAGGLAAPEVSDEFLHHLPAEVETLRAALSTGEREQEGGK